MLHKNVIEKKSGFRTLHAAEIDAVSGGTEGEPIIVTGERDPWVISIPGEALLGMQGDAWISESNIYNGEYGDGGGQFQEAGFVKDLKDWLEENAEWIADKLGKDLITPEKESALNTEMNTKDISSVGSVQVDGETWRTVTTTDGQTYYDRNGNGKADLKSQYTRFGTQYDNGDGDGWRMPGS